MALFAHVENALLGQRGHLFPWIPVCLAAGIGLYFALLFEPSMAFYAYGGGFTLLLSAMLVLYAPLSHGAWGPLIWAMCLISLGFFIAGYRAHDLDRPVLGWRYYGPVEGRIVGVDRSSKGALRITLDRVVLHDMAPRKTPARVRISVHSDMAEGGLAPGATIILTGHLSPPSGPSEPGGFDFRRYAWFQKLGAVGYTRNAILTLEPHVSGQGLLRARLAMSKRVKHNIGGEVGAFAAAIMTGDRAGMGHETLHALRVSNLAHLLAISGLHMGLLTGFVFGLFRLLLCAVPFVGLRIPVKKISAVLSLCVAAGYLALSGGNVATERAFVMVSVALVAVVLDRRVISLRAVAMAAIIVLCLRPEALLGPGFQMSFAATAALVAVFGWVRDRNISLGPRWMSPVAAVVISSIVAGAATAPVGAAHFNQISHFGLIGNLLSVPLMGAVVMPAAVLAVALMVVGLEGIALWGMELGLKWILGVAHWVSNLEGARGAIVQPEWFVLPLMAIGGIMIILWQGRLRYVGLGPVFASFLFWAWTDRPDVLVAQNGGLVGIMVDDRRALSKARGAGFSARIWLENDGDPVVQKVAAARWHAGIQGVAKRGAVRLPGQNSNAGEGKNMPNIRHITGKRAVADMQCAMGEIVVVNAILDRSRADAFVCDIYDVARLRETGSIAIYVRNGRFDMITAQQVSGARLWSISRRK